MLLTCPGRPPASPRASGGSDCPRADRARSGCSRTRPTDSRSDDQASRPPTRGCLPQVTQSGIPRALSRSSDSRVGRIAALRRTHRPMRTRTASPVAHGQESTKDADLLEPNPRRVAGTFHLSHELLGEEQVVASADRYDERLKISNRVAVKGSSVEANRVASD